MPRATVLSRDEMQGARPKASLDGLPGLATRPRNRLAVAVPDAAEFGMHGQAVRARKNTVPSGSDQNGPFAHQVPGRCVQHRLRNVGGAASTGHGNTQAASVSAGLAKRRVILGLVLSFLATSSRSP